MIEHEIGVVVFLICCIVYFLIKYLYVLFQFVGVYKFFKKAGISGWKCLIPIYNIFMLVKISGLNNSFFLLFFTGIFLFIPNFSFIGYIGIMIASFCIFYNLSLKLHINSILGGICGMFFAPIFLMAVGFLDQYQLDNSVQVNPYGPFKFLFNK